MLRWPTTAEQWGNVIVKVGKAKVTKVNPQYELFAVDDGTGSILVDDDSDSLQDYPDPPSARLPNRFAVGSTTTTAAMPIPPLCARTALQIGRRVGSRPAIYREHPAPASHGKEHGSRDCNHPGYLQYRHCPGGVEL
jgi:hypothetical protein